MAPSTPRVVIPIDLKKKPWEQKFPCHNQWHPDRPPVVDVTEGEVFRVEMVDCSGGSIGDNDSAVDIKFGSLLGAHYLSGPTKVLDKEGIPAKPGNVLAVEICNLGHLPGDEWGYTATSQIERMMVGF
ncbi:putative formamidase [Dioscorea sansibarensis]